MTITIPDPTTPDPPPITVTDQLLTDAALDAIAGSWPVIPGGDPTVRQFKRTMPLLPRTQAARILVLNAVLRATVGGLPAPTVDFFDFDSTLGASLKLCLLDNDRAGVDAWATLIGLPPAAMTESGTAYRAQIHGREDVWLGFTWVQVLCSMTGGTR